MRSELKIRSLHLLGDCYEQLSTRAQSMDSTPPAISHGEQQCIWYLFTKFEVSGFMELDWNEGGEGEELSMWHEVLNSSIQVICTTVTIS